MTLNGHVKESIFFGMSKECIELAKNIDLKSQIERKENIKFSEYFSNRKHASILFNKIVIWVNENYKDIRDRYSRKSTPDCAPELLENEVGIQRIIEVITSSLNTYIVKQVFGEDLYIQAINKLYPLGLRSEFFSKDGEESSRDFSFLLKN